LLAQVLDRANLQRALKQVRQNKGAPGIDGMTVDELPEYLKRQWPEIRAQLEAGRYRPRPVKRVEIPKADGKTRPLGIPTDSSYKRHHAEDRRGGAERNPAWLENEVSVEANLRAAKVKRSGRN